MVETPYQMLAHPARVRRVEQVVYDTVVVELLQPVQLFGGSSEACPSHQVSNQPSLLRTHRVLLDAEHVSRIVLFIRRRAWIVKTRSGAGSCSDLVMQESPSPTVIAMKKDSSAPHAVGAGLKPARPLEQDAVAIFIPLCGLHKAIVTLRSALLSF